MAGFAYLEPLIFNANREAAGSGNFYIPKRKAKDLVEKVIALYDNRLILGDSFTANVYDTFNDEYEPTSNSTLISSATIKRPNILQVETTSTTNGVITLVRLSMGGTSQIDFKRFVELQDDVTVITGYEVVAYIHAD